MYKPAKNLAQLPMFWTEQKPVDVTQRIPKIFTRPRPSETQLYGQLPLQWFVRWCHSIARFFDLTVMAPVLKRFCLLCLSQLQGRFWTRTPECLRMQRWRFPQVFTANIAQVHEAALKGTPGTPRGFYSRAILTSIRNEVHISVLLWYEPAWEGVVHAHIKAALGAGKV